MYALFLTLLLLFILVSEQRIHAVNPSKLKGWQLRGTMKVIKSMELTLDDGADIRHMQHMVNRKVVSEAYFETMLEGSKDEQ